MGHSARIEGMRGSVTALATPFRGGQLDEAALASLAERQVRRGSAGLVVCGSTGEAGVMSAAEQARAIAVVRESAGTLPVLAGCTAISTDAAASLARQAVRIGADALLLAPPPYVKPTQEGILAHVRAVAHAADRPVMLYDVPSRTGVAIADETVARLFEQGLIMALKDATGDLARPPRLSALCGSDLAQFSGEDASAAAHRAMGGVGCVSVSANVAPALCAALHRAWDASNLVAFGRLRDLLDPLHQALFAESNPIPLKAALAALRLCADELRLPPTRATPATRERLMHVLERISPSEDSTVPVPNALATP